MPASDKSSRSAWIRISFFFLIWFFANAITFLLIVFPFYPDVVDRSLGGFEKYSPDARFLLLTQVATFFATILSFWYFNRKQNEKFLRQEFYKVSFVQFRTGCLIGLFILIVCSCPLLYFHFISIQFENITSLPILIVIFILIAITEELIFRGYVLNILLEKINPRLAILWSSFLFAFFHISNNNLSWTGLINIFLFGILASVIYIKNNNLSAAIGLHFVWNLAQNLFGFAVSGQKMDGVFSMQYHSSNQIITGGDFGLEGSILLTPIVLIAILMYQAKSHFQPLKL
jgi:membrane protease YdiL (CAAX protease family)